MVICGYISVSRNFVLSVKDIHKKNLQAAKYAKECQLNQEKPREVKDSSYKFSKKINGKKLKAQITSFPLTSGAVLVRQRQYCKTGTTSAQGQYCRTDTKPIGVGFTRDGLPYLVYQH